MPHPPLRLPAASLAPIAALLLAGCGVNSVPTAEETAKARWAEVENEYRRRTDLIPNLIVVVRGYARQEQDILHDVAQARADAAMVRASIDDPASLRKYGDAQGRLSTALDRLTAAAEHYPDLKSNASFLALLAMLEGIENEIRTTSRDYDDAVRAYNARIHTFPDAVGAKLFYGAKPLPPFEATLSRRATTPSFIPRSADPL